ncbi:MAG: hypothetical protein GY737_29415 [Desulfobacteraceae bacterium]|nr:hypothetical protein [Desulfobacteraceae bacterium]
MRLRLELDNHCVESEIRRIYNARVGDCLKSGRFSADDEEVIELLKNLLETVDFSRLRSACRELAGNPGTDAELVLGDDRRVWIEIDNKRISMDGTWERRTKTGWS